MVRSMMSQTTLPKSFWDYALETAARILNMVPTKKVEKTPYENTHPSIDTSLNHEEDDLELELDEPQSDIIPIRRSTRTRRPTDRMCLYIDAEEHELGDLGEPTNYKAASLDPESDKWLNAMNVEMQSMKDNRVWILVELPPNGKIVGSKWLFKKKTDMDGAVHTYKARLVAKGYTQTPGIDYEETFSPVADIRAIRILIAIAAYYDYEIWQMDVKTAFLNGYLSEEVYMEQPEGFVNPKYPNRVCKLKRSIYGLKQASRQWNKRFDDEIKKFGFSQNADEPCVYLKASGSNVTFLILYVDDILIMGNSIPMLQDVKSYLGRCFAMKDLGEAAYILGIKIYRDRSRRLIGLCQSAYIEKTLKRFHMENSKRGSIPIYVFILNGGVVDWKSIKQSIFAISSTESEYIAGLDASKEALMNQESPKVLHIFMPKFTVGIQCLLDAVGITATHFKVTTACENLRFGRNAAIRKTQMNLLKQQYENFTTLSSEMLDQNFDRLQNLVIQNRADLDTMSMDDPYKNLKSDQAEEGPNYALMAFSSSSPDSKGNPQMYLQDQGVIDSGCSRHMIGNMSYLTDYEEIDGEYKELCNSFEKLMQEKFQMSSMGELTFFLGLQVKQKKDGIFISQDKYVTEI
ncbi:retrotransposon protein, putative, ty1-copia subclass [Tanacetum coccineum]